MKATFHTGTNGEELESISKQGSIQHLFGATKKKCQDINVTASTLMPQESTQSLSLQRYTFLLKFSKFTYH